MNWTDFIPWIYISIQVSISLLVSIMGALFVKTEFKRQKNKTKQMGIQQNIEKKARAQRMQKLQIELQIKQGGNTAEQEDISQGMTNIEDAKIEEPLQEDDLSTVTKKPVQVAVDDMKEEETANAEQIQKFKMLSKIGFCKLYLSTVWKMRSVYGSLAVHAFDVLTDGLVIVNWWNYEKDQDIENVDARIMAWCGIAVLSFHKLISVMAFWAKEASVYRCLLQLLDLLIFEEIYISHKKILVQLSDENEENDDDAIETTSTFKYVRNLEAIFESIPQSILQLVFIMRTKWEEESEEGSIFLIISIASILQSIISMTNSILKNDNVYMTLPKFKPYKKRAPPSWKFIKHLLARLSEVVYRIGLFALFWSVCEGAAFGVMLGTEILLLIILVISYDKIDQGNDLNIDDLCLRVQAIVVIPSEFIYEREAGGLAGAQFDCEQLRKCERECIGFFLGCLPCFCCYTPATLLSSLCHLRKKEPYRHPGVRIGLSMIEWLFLIIWAIVYPDRRKFLLSVDYGLAIFMVSGIAYFIHTQYTYFFPDFALPGGVSIRSIYGYAFNGELEEIDRLNVPKKFKKLMIAWDDNNPSNSKLPEGIERDTVWGAAFYGDLEAYKKHSELSDGAWGHSDFHQMLITPIILAYSNNQDEIIKYIEESTSTRFKGKICEDMSLEIARAYLMADYWDKPYTDRWVTNSCNTPAMHALAMGQYHVVEYLEKEKGAKLHTAIFNAQTKYKIMGKSFGRKFVGDKYFGNQE